MKLLPISPPQQKASTITAKSSQSYKDFCGHKT
jgi:hypothetical protein